MNNPSTENATVWKPVKNDESIPNAFHWHGDTNVVVANNTNRTSNPSVITLNAIQQAVTNQVEFCVESAHLVSTIPMQQSSTFFQCMSSGTNGQPKRVRRSHASWINSFQVTQANTGLGCKDSYAIIGQLSHSLSLYAALEAAWLGADIHAMTELRPHKQYNALIELKTTVLYATPTQLRLLCGGNHQQTTINTDMQFIFCGGGKLDKTTLTLLKNQFPQASIKEFYGASETSFITMSDANTPIDSVGKAYPGVEINIKPIDAEPDNVITAEYNGEHRNENETETENENENDSNNGNGNGNNDRPKKFSIGEIWVRSPYLFDHYAVGEEHDTQWHNDFLSVGELGYLDAKGYLYLAGRRSRMVTIADNNVFPEQAESLLNNHASVAHCAVIPVSDPQRGATLLAIIEAQDKTINTETMRTDLLKLCRQTLGAHHSPKNMIVVDSLPLLASGKPDLQTLHQQYQSA